MTGLEEVLLGVVILFGGGIGSKIVLPGVSQKDHKALKELMATRFNNVEQRLERMENKIDKGNGNK